MKQAIKDAHNMAFEQVKDLFNPEELKELFYCYIRGELSKEDIKQIINFKIEDAKNVYLQSFIDSILSYLIEKGISSVTNHVKELDSDEYRELLENFAYQAKNLIQSYILGEIDKNTFTQRIQDISYELGYDFIKAFGINLKDLQVIENAIENSKQLRVLWAIYIEYYKMLMALFDEGHLMHEQRIMYEEECNKRIEELQHCREEMEENVSRYMHNHLVVLQSGLDMIDEALLTNNTDQYIQGNVKIQKLLGYNVQFETFDELDALMESDEDLFL